MPDFETFPLHMLDEHKDDETLKKQTHSATLRANQLLSVLKSKGLAPQLISSYQGGLVTRYELQLKKRLSERALSDLSDELPILLATYGVRAYREDDAILHVEVPNEYPSVLSLRSLLEEDAFQNATSPLTVPIGMDLYGNPVFADLKKLPHLLIAGTTGSGKSISAYALLLSLLYKNTPDQLKLILIDPKSVEFKQFIGLDHLMMPIITDVRRALASLHFAMNEMERRYELLEQAEVRNIDDFNRQATKDKLLPHIVILIDDLDHLMIASREDCTNTLGRLAVKGRCVGIHLVLSTQRCDSNTLDTCLRANIPCRLVFRVTTMHESRLLLSTRGAEQLLGRADAYFQTPGTFTPIRVQCPFVDYKQLSHILDLLRQKSPSGNRFDLEILAQIEKELQEQTPKRRKKQTAPPVEAEELEEPLYDQAVAFAKKMGICSVSALQRALSIGYGRASRLMDTMERRGVFAPGSGVIRKKAQTSSDFPLPDFITAAESENKALDDDLLQDPLYDKAVQIVLEQGVCNAGGLQKALNIGYGRAAKIAQEIEESGILSDPDDVIQKRMPLFKQEGQAAPSPTVIKCFFDKNADDYEPLLLDAADAISEYGKASTAVLQRALSIGYGKASRLLDLLEQAGVISAYTAQGERTLLFSKDEWAKQRTLLK